jgi:hypothetical protein
MTFNLRSQARRDTTELLRARVGRQVPSGGYLIKTFSAKWNIGYQQLTGAQMGRC